MLAWPTPRGDFEHQCLNIFNWAQGIFFWTEDQQVWHLPEFWATESDLEKNYEENNGRILDDCDGFAAMCVVAARKVGLRSVFATCRTETGGYHCVCIIRRDNEALMLDNRQGRPLSITEAERIGYVFDMCSGEAPGEPWRKL